MKITTSTVAGSKVVSDSLGNVDHVLYALVNAITTIVQGLVIVMEDERFYITSNNTDQITETQLLVIFPSAVKVEVGSIDGSY
jgi:hypothetical protein